MRPLCNKRPPVINYKTPSNIKTPAQKRKIFYITILDENEGGNPFEDTTDHTEIPEMCLIEADGDDSDVDIDIM